MYVYIYIYIYIYVYIRTQEPATGGHRGVQGAHEAPQRNNMDIIY